MTTPTARIRIARAILAGHRWLTPRACQCSSQSLRENAPMLGCRRMMRETIGMRWHIGPESHELAKRIIADHERARPTPAYRGAIIVDGTIVPKGAA